MWSSSCLVARSVSGVLPRAFSSVLALVFTPQHSLSSCCCRFFSRVPAHFCSFFRTGSSRRDHAAANGCRAGQPRGGVHSVTTLSHRRSIFRKRGHAAFILIIAKAARRFGIERRSDAARACSNCSTSLRFTRSSHSACWCIGIGGERCRAATIADREQEVADRCCRARQCRGRIHLCGSLPSGKSPRSHSSSLLCLCLLNSLSPLTPFSALLQAASKLAPSPSLTASSIIHRTAAGGPPSSSGSSEFDSAASALLSGGGGDGGPPTGPSNAGGFEQSASKHQQLVEQAGHFLDLACTYPESDKITGDERPFAIHSAYLLCELMDRGWASEGEQGRGEEIRKGLGDQGHKPPAGLIAELFPPRTASS